MLHSDRAFMLNNEHIQMTKYSYDRTITAITGPVSLILPEVNIVHKSQCLENPISNNTFLKDVLMQINRRNLNMKF